MDKPLSGKVAFVTGAARGQGRSHAVRLASLGADILAVDIADALSTVHYPAAAPEDLHETQRLVEELDQRCIARIADVRDQDALDAAVQEARAELGEIGVVVANAGIVTLAPTWEVTDAQWDEVIGVNLTGVWRTVKAAIPSMIAAGAGGSIIMTSSTNGHRGGNNLGHYTASKHGVEGLMRSLANELAPYGIRANCVAPTNVGTTMILNEGTFKVFRPDLENPGLEEAREAYQSYHLLQTPYVEPEDVSNAVEYLATDKSRYVTGTVIDVDCGFGAKFPG